MRDKTKQDGQSYSYVQSDSVSNIPLIQPSFPLSVPHFVLPILLLFFWLLSYWLPYYLSTTISLCEEIELLCKQHQFLRTSAAVDLEATFARLQQKITEHKQDQIKQILDAPTYNSVGNTTTTTTTVPHINNSNPQSINNLSDNNSSNRLLKSSLLPHNINNNNHSHNSSSSNLNVLNNNNNNNNNRPPSRLSPLERSPSVKVIVSIPYFLINLFVIESANYYNIHFLFPSSSLQENIFQDTLRCYQISSKKKNKSELEDGGNSKLYLLIIQ